MNDPLRKRFERQRSAAVGATVAHAGAPGRGEQAKDILKASFEQYSSEHREIQEQVQEARRERALRYWEEAKTEQEES